MLSSHSFPRQKTHHFLFASAGKVATDIRTFAPNLNKVRGFRRTAFTGMSRTGGPTTQTCHFFGPGCVAEAYICTYSSFSTIFFVYCDDISTTLHHTVLFFSRFTIIRDAEGHALSTPLLPEGHESGLRHLSDDGRQMVLAAIVAWRRGLWLSITTITASDHRLTLEGKQVEFSWWETCGKYDQQKTQMN